MFMRGTLAAVLLTLAPAARAANDSLSGDYGRMMGWLSREMVQPLAFNAGTSFDPPEELRLWQPRLELSIGLGILPLDTAAFPVLANQTLNDLNAGSLFPQRVPFPELTGALRIGLPYRTDLALRAKNVTAPRIQVVPGTEIQGQSNNVGVQLRKFWGGAYGAPKVSLSGHFNYLFGGFQFFNKFEDVELPESPCTGTCLVLDAVNSGDLDWAVTSVGANLVVSKEYGHWLPFVGVGVNRAVGSLEAKLRTDFDSFLMAPAEGLSVGVTHQTNVRALFGAQFQRRTGRDVFVSGEMLVAGGEGRTFSVHLGVLFPARVGKAREVHRKGAVVVDEETDSRDRRVGRQELIFIR